MSEQTRAWDQLIQKLNQLKVRLDAIKSVHYFSLNVDFDRGSNDRTDSLMRLYACTLHTLVLLQTCRRSDTDSIYESLITSATMAEKLTELSQQIEAVHALARHLVQNPLWVCIGADNELIVARSPIEDTRHTFRRLPTIARAVAFERWATPGITAEEKAVFATHFGHPHMTEEVRRVARLTNDFPALVRPKSARPITRINDLRQIVSQEQALKAVNRVQTVKLLHEWKQWLLKKRKRWTQLIAAIDEHITHLQS